MEKIYRDIVVLYCPEKVGSTSIVSSIRLSAPDKFMVFHTHENKIADILNYPTNQINISDIILNNKIINPQNNQCRKIYIIDIFRTPIERKQSYFFQKISEIHFNNLESNISKYPIEKIIKRFNDIFIHMDDIDYYNTIYNCNPIQKFDYDKKYVMTEVDNVFYIKLRLQDSKYWDSILSEIFQTKIYLIHDYNTTMKEIGDLYNRFKSEYKLPYNFYEILKNDVSLDIYLSPEEKSTYLKNWFEKIGKPHIPFNTIEYNIYKKISEENKFYCANTSNKHYGDDGCLCQNCSTQRKNILSKLQTNSINSEDIYIRHPYDDAYDNNIYIQLFPIPNSKPFELTINLINL